MATPKDTFINDRLNSILIQESRQSLRGNIFIITILLLHTILIFVSVFTMVDEISGMSDDDLLNITLFFTGAGLICVIIPFRAFLSVSANLKRKHHELTALTQINGWTVASGVWLSSASITLLFITSALPYMVLRYYIAGADIVLELMFLGIFTGIGLLLSTAMILLATYRNWWLRLCGFGIAGVVALITTVSCYFLYEVYLGAGLYRASSVGKVEESLLLGAFIYFSLGPALLIAAAQRLSPDSTPILWLKRIILSFLWLLALLAASIKTDPEFVFLTVAPLFLLLPLVVDTLHEEHDLRRGTSGRFFPFRAGWPAASLFIYGIILLTHFWRWTQFSSMFPSILSVDQLIEVARYGMFSSGEYAQFFLIIAIELVLHVTVISLWLDREFYPNRRTAPVILTFVIAINFLFAWIFTTSGLFDRFLSLPLLIPFPLAVPFGVIYHLEEIIGWSYSSKTEATEAIIAELRLTFGFLASYPRFMTFLVLPLILHRLGFLHRRDKRRDNVATGSP